MMEKLFAVCTPGLESFTATELNRWGLMAGPTPTLSEAPPEQKESPPELGGIEFQGSLHDLYRANLYLHTASRILTRLGEFHAVSFPELRRKASHLNWENYLSTEHPVTLRVSCQKSRLYHEGAVAERIAGAIADRLGNPPSVQKYREAPESDPPQLIVVRLMENHCTISIDSSGALLHRRGYRLATGKAPLRETLASGMLMASGWKSPSPLLDPFCGSGTIPIEAALMARKIPPGYSRRFAFMDWPNFDSRFWKKLLDESGRGILPIIPDIIASDRDAGAIRAARANAERAGVADCIQFSCKSISGIDPPPSSGWIVANPPFGLRLSKKNDLRNLYAQLGKVFRLKCPGWHLTLLCDSLRLIQNTGLKFEKELSINHGGRWVKLVSGVIQRGIE